MIYCYFINRIGRVYKMHMRCVHQDYRLNRMTVERRLPGLAMHVLVFWGVFLTRPPSLQPKKPQEKMQLRC